MVQETKEVLRKLSEGHWSTKLSRFLLGQHISPTTTTGKSPAELLIGRRLRSAIDRLHLDFHLDGSSLQRYFLDGSRSVRHFYPGDAVYARNYQGGTKWVPGFVTSVTGPLSYQVRLSAGSLWRRHVDHIRSRASPLDLGDADSDSGGATTDDVDPSAVGQDPPLRGVNGALPSSGPPVSPAPEPDNPDVPGSPSQEQSSPSLPRAAEASRYPRRDRRAPQRYPDYIP
ncbi:hypothetical protein MTO96_038414 [Rhipicephalus appendiculatus]